LKDNIKISIVNFSKERQLLAFFGSAGKKII